MNFKSQQVCEIPDKYGKLVSMIQFHGYILVATEYGMIYRVVMDEVGTQGRLVEFLKV